MIRQVLKDIIVCLSRINHFEWWIIYIVGQFIVMRITRRQNGRELKCSKLQESI